MLYLIGILVKIAIVVGISQGAVAYLILVERKIAAWRRTGSVRTAPARSACSSRSPTAPR